MSTPQLAIASRARISVISAITVTSATILRRWGGHASGIVPQSSILCRQLPMRGRSRSTVAPRTQRYAFHALAHPPHLQLPHAIFQILDIFPPFPNLGVRALLHGRVVGLLSQCTSAIDKGLLPLDFLVDLADELVVVHDCGSGVLFCSCRERLRTVDLAVCQLPNILVAPTAASDSTRQIKAVVSSVVRTTFDNQRQARQSSKRVL